MADGQKLGAIEEAILKGQLTRAQNNVLAQDPEELKKWTGDNLNLDDQRLKDASTLKDLSGDLLEERRKRAIAQGLQIIHRPAALWHRILLLFVEKKLLEKC